MVLSLLVSFGTAVGAHEGIKASMAKSRKEEHRSRKNNLIVHCPKSSQYSPYLEGRRVVLSGDRLFIDTGTVHDAPFGHPFEGYYIPYPDSRYAGLVTTITHEAPIMNWVFMDPLTYSFQFGVRAVADANLTGPWDCTRQDRRLTFCGWEGFCAVLEDSGVWGLYYDFDGDGMRKKFGQEGRVVIEIELIRSELRTPKPEPEPEPQPEPEIVAEPQNQDKAAEAGLEKQVEAQKTDVDYAETKSLNKQNDEFNCIIRTSTSFTAYCNSITYVMARNPAAFKAMRSRQVQRFIAQLQLSDPNDQLLNLVSEEDLDEAAKMAKLSKADDDEDFYPESWANSPQSFKLFFNRYFRQWAAAQRDRDAYDGPSKGTRSQAAQRLANA
ncbi:hypothetical protein CkaCkLH20_04375 [Colletotrichum karsti]|uniref:Uncharacterized protein n=1 Tax=Colletotrichum karsti TaxID=1095194 RepID=A0A9P6I7I3_9PEZI|nr:uncharacterized protein CkaCkLH20_04375 [Colletotrichum karsti]KAF9878337.1 hypothetical protein CkaCkLH20_04375 [Colletotrichum karsti]